MRLIDADELRNEVDNYDFSEYSDYSNMIDMIDDASTIEAEPVKRGKWIDVDYKTLEHGFLETYPDEGVCCSECRTGFKKSRQLIRNFCPNCGARMDGDTNEEP